MHRVTKPHVYDNHNTTGIPFCQQLIFYKTILISFKIKHILSCNSDRKLHPFSLASFALNREKRHSTPGRLLALSVEVIHGRTCFPREPAEIGLENTGEGNVRDGGASHGHCLARATAADGCYRERSTSRSMLIMTCLSRMNLLFSIGWFYIMPNSSRSIRNDAANHMRADEGSTWQGVVRATAP